MRLAASQESNEAIRWGLLIGVGGAVLLTVLLAATGLEKAMVIGRDNRLSTSKTVAGLWTVVVAGGLVGFVYAQLLGHPQALDNTNHSGVVGQYALLFGGPLGAAIAAKGIVSRQVTNDPSAKSPAPRPKLQDLVADDAGNTDLGDFQYVLFNAVALFFVIGNLLVHSSGGLPRIPDVLLGLTSVSAVGFVSKKALVPPAGPTRKVLPAEAAKPSPPAA
ncbi:MAG: hypothetical protein M3Z06_07085 [Actinomycetota bacterium]|nr:hypothetical protein [Actinomycetota bacterium]